MAPTKTGGYLPGDPRYGLSGDTLRRYYSEKPAQSYFKSYEDSFIFRGPLRSPDGAENIGTALLLELPDRTAAEKFWNNEPFAANGGYQDDSRIYRWEFGD